MLLPDVEAVVCRAIVPPPRGLVTTVRIVFYNHATPAGFNVQKSSIRKPRSGDMIMADVIFNPSTPR